MKMKKFLLCMTTTTLIVANTVSINAFAAEVNTVEQVQNSEAVNTSVIDVDTQAGETTTGDSTNTKDSAITEGTSTTEDTSKTENDESNQEVVQDTTKESSKDSKNDETDSKKKTDSEKATKKKTTTTKKKTSITKKKTSAKTTKAASYSSAEVRLLSTLIYCEAGNQSYAGKLAVGIVVVNRMDSKKYPNSLKGVIYQKHQFGPVRNGSLNKALNEYDNGRFTSAQEKQCIKAAKAALSGVKTIKYTKNGKSLSKNLSGYYGFSGRLSNPRFTLGDHQFK